MESQPAVAGVCCACTAEEASSSATTARNQRFKDTSDYYFIYLQWAIVLFLLWLLLKSTFLTNVLQD